MNKLKVVKIDSVLVDILGKYKQWSYGELKVIQTIDDLTESLAVADNFGTLIMPSTKYKHTSISHPTRYPTWEELKEIKELVHGDVFVFQAMPPKRYYVNLHPNCFHLWEPLLPK